MGAKWVRVVALLAYLLACPLGVSVVAFEVAPLLSWRVLLLWSCVHSFCPHYCFVLGASLANMALFRVLRAFIWVYRLLVWVCVVLVLCVACVAFVRVWS